MNLWGGRFTVQLDELANQMNSSLKFDHRLAEVDIKGSKAWANAIHACGVISEEENQAIQYGLDDILDEFRSGHFQFSAGDEDIHTAVERRLTEMIGPTGGKLHTGRSRNDQVATDLRLYLLAEIPLLEQQLKSLQKSLIVRAEKDWAVIMPGYTHTQQAQPILMSHWWLSFFWMLERDRKKLSDIIQETGVMPLGCAAMAGTSFPVDRVKLAKNLGFSSPAINSIDAISDRDFVASYLFAVTLMGIHLSKMAESMILFSTKEFGFITLSDAFSTGSSIMPQKKNPDLLELTRAQAGKFIGLLTGMLAILKGLPGTYDKDLQEDKPLVFEAADRTMLSLMVMEGMLSSLEINPEKIRTMIDPMTLATDLADRLVLEGIPFREAHRIIGQIVRYAVDQHIQLEEVPIEVWKEHHQDFKDGILENITLEKSVQQHAAYGGTAPDRVREQLELAKKCLNADGA